MRCARLIPACLLLLAGCARVSNEETAIKFHSDGRAKPVVAIVPIFDRSGAEVPWNLSEELTDTIQKRLARRSKIYLVEEERVRSATNSLDAHHHPFGQDLSWAKKAFGENEYVVFMELVTHQLTPHEKESPSDEVAETSYTLDLTMRVRVIDVRGQAPQIVLQELVSQSHYIPKLLTHIDYTKNGWGKLSYNVTPYGLSHIQFTREISKRLEDYILISKSQ